jgi:CHASE3 domain sensor protein
MSTVGYGDLNPTTPLSKIFTMVFVFLSISVFVSFVSMLAKERGHIQQQRAQQLKKRSYDNPPFN